MEHFFPATQNFNYTGFPLYVQVSRNSESCSKSEFADEEAMGMGRKLFSRETLRTISKYELRALISGNKTQFSMGSKHLRRNPNPGEIQIPYLPYQLKMGFSGSSLLSSSQNPNTILLKNLVQGRRYYKGLNFPNFKPKNSWKLRVKLIAVFVGSYTAFYLYNQEIIPYTNRPHFVFVSTEREKLGSDTFFEQLKKDILKGEMLAADHPKTLRVNSIAQNLIKALQDGISQTDTDFASYDQFKLENKRVVLSWRIGKSQPEVRHLEDLNWEVVVINLPIPSAWCVTGGKIIVSNGVLEHFDTDAQIAAFIAHKVGHLVARHPFEWRYKEMWKCILKWLLCFFVTPDVVHSIMFLRIRPSSTEIENEANYIGLMLMASAGYDPVEAVITYKKLEILTRNLPNKPCMMRSKVLSQTDAMRKAKKLYDVKRQIAESEIKKTCS